MQTIKYQEKILKAASKVKQITHKVMKIKFTTVFTTLIIKLINSGIISPKKLGDISM